jgi:hypothetical protein
VSEVLAGFICGYALALGSAPLVALALLRLRSRVPTVARAVPEQVPVVALTVVIFGFTFLLWSALGIVFGLTLKGLEERAPEGGLGSPSLAFTLVIVFACAVACIPPALMLRSGRRYVIAAAVVFVGVFGWLMPYLAQWGPIASS